MAISGHVLGMFSGYSGGVVTKTVRRMSKVKHIEQPRQVVRVVLPEEHRTSLRISKAGRAAFKAMAEESGKPEWQLFDEMVGVA
jgi:hypothetical protein